MSLDLWQRACERLAAELPAQQFNTWIRPLAATTTAAAEAAEGEAQPPLVVSIRVPNRFKLDWIRAQYAHRIEAVLAELAGAPVRLDLGIAAQPASPARAEGAQAAALRRSQPVSAVTVALDSIPGHLGEAAFADVPTRSIPSNAPAAHSHRLNTALTFDTLVAGRANQMARTAALHVAGNPGAMYNPLFIYGGVGLGKTHLVHAVGNALLKDRPDARVLYLHA